MIVLVTVFGALMIQVAKAKKGTEPDDVKEMMVSFFMDEHERGFASIHFRSKNKHAVFVITEDEGAERIGAIYSKLYALFNQDRAVLLEEVQKIKEAYNI